MREISLIFILFSTILASEFHVHSLKHVQKRHDIPLEFIMNSHEHSDIRRSVHLEKDDKNLERLSSDKFVVRRDETPSKSSDSSSEVVGDATSIPDKFDQPSYDFMLPEGNNENSTILAVVDFITRKHNVKPTFIVNFDENEWFDIGNIEKTRADNADVYKATVILRPNANVEISKTEGGLYKFVVEAQQGDVVLATTNISVDVISLAPTTKRVRVTVPSEPKMATEAVKAEATTTVNSGDSTESSESDVLTLGGPSSESPDTSEEAPETSESSISPESSTESSASSGAPESQESLTTSATSPDDVLTIGGSDDDLTTPVSTPTAEEEEEEVEVLDSESQDASGEGSAEESSGELPESQEDPITGPITILPLRTSPDGEIQPIENVHLNLRGAPEDTIQIPRGARPGDVIRGVNVDFQGVEGQEIQLSIEPEGILEIRPASILSGEETALFLQNIPEIGDVRIQKLEVVARFVNSSIRSPFQLNFETTSESSEGSDMLSLREIEFGVMESAESGRTIGQVDGDLKIIGGNGNRRFSLVGNDLILSCGQFDTEKCLQDDAQKTFSLILMPKNGELAPVQVTILVQQQASLRTSDKVIRISDNRIISPFAVITERTRKNIKLDGDAAKFLGFLKAQEGLYQLIVVNSAASGRYTLQISLEDSGDVGSSPESPNQKIDVFVENSQSHAHFRKPKYSLEIDANTVENGVKLTHVELEGVPIDEAKIMILDGNPGWVTVEEYGGKVNVGKYDGPIYTGKSSIRIGAVDKKTWTILTETLVEIDVKNGQEPVENEQDSSENLEKSRVLEATFDREKSETFDIQLDDKSLKLDLKSMYGIDEKGRKVPLDPTTIQVTPTHLQIAPESLKSLRLLGLTLKNPKTSETTAILVRLISSPEYLEIQRKLAARPIYPSPWTRDSNEIHVELKEELALGQVVGVYPAVSRQNMSQNSRQIQISGPMKEAFDFDEMTGELKLKQRIDFESLDENQKMFNLTLVSGDEGYRSEAILMVKVLDVDDNAPVVDMGQMEEISLPENLAAGTKIAEFDVTDPDGSDSYKVELEGEGNQNFRAEINSNGTLSIFISEASQIDRETKDAMAILVKISDVSGNSERILLPIRILDVNDNAPEFEEPMYEIEAMEDWPRGVVIHRIHAKDSDDVGPASDVSYRILRNSEDVPDVISVNSTTGVIQVSGDLWGLGREMPYKFEVVAEDSGAPKMNSSSILSLRIRGKGDVITEETVEFLEPKFGGAVVKVKENLPLDTKIFTVKADLRGIPNKTSGKLVYSIKDLLKTEKEPTFAIDKDSGEVFVTREIDYERLKEYTVSFRRIWKIPGKKNPLKL
ncbi:hypothetical protein L3Y34_005693 [Caenorhabditis briggsae]|uniref:Cadherin domain-containing protein n=1 Tax=Caenorhabditis briggsae TaxID=6238 RepID=A0AAE9D7P3_CAEBR|nr:hypothetical protein L3Y34_005693 [Caenorhabditis briggsae]